MLLIFECQSSILYLMYRIRTCIALSFCILLAGSASGSDTDPDMADPIYAANQNPFAQIFGLPKAEPGTLTPKGKLEVGFLYFVSNNSISNNAPNGETIIWDGETAQYTLRFRYGATDYLELGVDLPVVQHSGGYLDSLIRNYHDMMGFPNNRQEQFAKNQINYQVTDNGTETYALNEPRSGLGDIRFSAAIPLLRNDTESKRYLAIRSMLKLPTGESNDLLGSGGTDLSLGLAYSDYELLSKLNIILSAHAGLLYLGDAEVLESLQNHYAGYGGLFANWHALRWLDLKLQLDVHSAFYDSELKQLGSSLQLLGGAAVKLPGEIYLDFGISEQLITDATPDVGFYLMARRLF
jgi:hypothetical protein